MPKKKSETADFIDELERTADKYAKEIPGAYSKDHRELRANCIIDLALAFVHEQSKRGRYTSTGGAWHSIEKAANFLATLEGKGASSAFSMVIQGLDPDNLIIQKVDGGSQED